VRRGDADTAVRKTGEIADGVVAGAVEQDVVGEFHDPNVKACNRISSSITIMV
jgi:hypothetical protein